jgi:hypothetical protein
MTTYHKDFSNFRGEYMNHIVILLCTNLRVKSINIQNARVDQMAYFLNSISKQDARNTSSRSPSTDTPARANSSCSFVNCTIKPISRCSRCLEYYCYDHTYGHIHAIENFEIL